MQDNFTLYFSQYIYIFFKYLISTFNIFHTHVCAFLLLNDVNYFFSVYLMYLLNHIIITSAIYLYTFICLFLFFLYVTSLSQH